jgi:hypothetical protein
MDRRELLGALGAGAAGLLAAGGSAEAQEQNRFQYRSQLDKTHVDCLDACTACAAVCNEASHHCLAQIQKGSTDKDHHARAHHLAMDCATVCAASAALVARQSPLMDLQCNACADACRRCAEECEKDQSDASIMKDCVRICRECERSCREMVRAMGGRSGGTR